MRDIGGDFVGMLDAGANRRAGEIIAGEEEAGRTRAEISQSGRDVLMADVVLGQGARPTRHVLRDRGSGYAQDGGELRVSDGSDLLRAARS